MNRLKGKHAIITGVASGIGKATAILFAQEGAFVIGVDIDETGGIATIQEINANSGENCGMFIKADLGKSQDVRNVVEQALKVGKIDILFNNAGIEVVKSLVESSESDWDRTIEVNLKSVFLMCKYVIPHMIKEKSGTIINNSSVAGIIGSFSPVYSASKGGIIAFTKSIAVDYAKDNIRINAISPGAIETPMLERVNFQLGELEQVIQERKAKYPMHRFGNVEEIAKTVLFLATDDSSFITGHNLIIDGGFSSQ